MTDWIRMIVRLVPEAVRVVRGMIRKKKAPRRDLDTRKDRIERQRRRIDDMR